MYERFTDRARKVMQLANQEAQRFNHEYIGTEHILLGLVKEGSGVAANVLKNLDIDLTKIRLEVEKIVQSGPDMVRMGKLPQTPRAKKVLEYSIEEARNLNHNYVGTEHLLLGLLREEEGVASQVLMNFGLKLTDLREETLNLLGHNDIPSERPRKEQPQPTTSAEADLPRPIREALHDLIHRLEQLALEKVSAIADQDFEKAAQLRDESDKLKREQDKLVKTFRGKRFVSAHEYDLYLPLKNRDGALFDTEKLLHVRARLMERFGGVLEFRQWIEGTLKLVNVTLGEEVVIYRVYSRESAQAALFFTDLKEELKADLGLDDILILSRKVNVL